MEEKVIIKRPPKSPALAGILAIFLPFGVAAFYNGQILKGFIFLITFSGLVSMQSHEVAQPFIGILLAGFYFYQIIEAIQNAKSLNRRAMAQEEAGEGKEEFPQFVKTGSIFWGATLLALGVIFLLANFEVISYDTIFDFWPVVIIVIGVKLVADYLTKKNNKS